MINNGLDLVDDSKSSLTDYADLAHWIKELAQEHEGEPESLLALLRILEQMHRDVRETYFRNALPTTRQALYTLLRDIEAEGGWPYIPRMHLRELLQDLQNSQSRNLEP